MDSYDVIEFAKTYRDWGWSVQEQFDSVMDGRGEECNPAAIQVMFESIESIRVKAQDDEALGEIVYAVTTAYDLTH